MAYSSTAKTALTSAKATLAAAKSALGSGISAEDEARLDAALAAIVAGISEPDPTEPAPPPPPPPEPAPDPDPDNPDRFAWGISNLVIGWIRSTAQSSVVATSTHTSAKAGTTYTY